MTDKPAGTARAGTLPVAGIGMAGYAFMGRAHSHAWRNVARVFDVPVEPRMVAVCGRNAGAVRDAAARLGWEDFETDWRALIARDDVDIVDVSTPGSSHAEIAIAALDAGKHVLCEKPLANTVEEAVAMAEAARRARERGVRSMVAYNYRRVPAVELARRLIAEGRLGTVHHVRAVYLQDWIVDPAFPMVWRLDAAEAGSGSLGDIGSHIVDLAQHLLAEPITSVCGLTETFVKERPIADPAGPKRPVTVDDAALFLARFGSGAVASFEATRFATGRKNGLRIEINGSDGSLVFDLERLNELELYEAAHDPAGFRRVLVTEGTHPWVGAWWPPGHILGWEHTFTHQCKDFLDAIAGGTDPEPSFEDGLRVQRVLQAVLDSAASGSWTDCSET